MRRVQARAEARVGLLGNPSDLYSGRGLGFTVTGLGVEVVLESARSASRREPLFEAAWSCLVPLLETRGIRPEDQPHELSFTTNVPFQSGLSGSSALLVAALRAWSEWYALPLRPARIAELAWRAENEKLGIRAGPLDRLVQAFGGLLAMDFRAPFAHGQCGVTALLDPILLPPLLIAWHGTSGTSSGDVHAPVFARWEAGDSEVRRVMDALAANAVRGQAALVSGERAAFRACVDRNFDLRSAVFPIAPADRTLIELGRNYGAAAKFPGSGGSVLFACCDTDGRAELESVCRSAGYTTLQPRVGPSCASLA